MQMKESTSSVNKKALLSFKNWQGRRFYPNLDLACSCGQHYAS
jgi:hypothetical protein